SAMRGRKLWRLRKGSLPSCLLGGIHIHHGPMRSLAVPYPTCWGGERRSGHQIFLKERAQCLHRGLIKSSKKARKRPSMRQLRSDLGPLLEGGRREIW